MNFYYYNLKQLFRSHSTLIIFTLGIAAAIICPLEIWHLNYEYTNSTSDNIPEITVSALRIKLLLINRSIIWIIESIIILFLAFKVCQLYRDSINDGSILLTITKPISRRKIFWSKWFALLTIFTIFVLAMVIAEYGILSILLHRINNIVLKIIGGQIIVFYLTFLIISALQMLISLKFSFKTIYAVSIFAMAIFPAFNLTDSFTDKYEQPFRDAQINPNLNYIRSETNGEFKKHPLNLAIKKFSGSGSKYHHHYSSWWMFDLSYHARSISRIFGQNNPTQRSKQEFIDDHLPTNFTYQKFHTDQHFHDYFLSKDAQIEVTSLNNFLKNQQYPQSQNSAYQTLQSMISDQQNYLKQLIKAGPKKPIPNIIVSLNDFVKTSPEKNYETVMNNIVPFVYQWWNTNNPTNPMMSLGGEDILDHAINKKVIANGLFQLYLNYYISNANLELLNSHSNYNLSYYNFSTPYAESAISLGLLKYRQANRNNSEPYLPSNNIRWNPGSSIMPLMNKEITYLNNNYHGKHIIVTINDFYSVDYKNFANPTTLLIVYSFLGIGLSILPYLLFRRLDIS